jgi:signal transduction histidine kinase
MEEEPRANILLVDDKVENLLALEAVLEELGENLVTARSGSEALRRALEKDFAVILLDVQMPEMDGFETARLLRERERSSCTPIIFLTAQYTTDFDANLGYSSGAVDYIVKPFSPQILRSKVRVFVELFKKTREIEKQSERLRQLERAAYERQLASITERMEQESYRARQELISKEMQARLAEEESRRFRELNRVKGEFLAQMSHEIRTPMTGVIGFTELLLTTELDGDQREIASLIRDSGLSLLGILNDILDLSKIEAGKLTLERIDFDVGRLIKDAADIFSQTAREKNLRLTTSTDAAAAGRFCGDPTRIRQILLNLVGNAVKFTEEGQVAVRVERVRQEKDAITLRFSVKDTGPGLLDSEARRLFQPFTQADRSIARQYGGTGLGLFVCRRLVELMNGTIGVDSSKGQGSTFWFVVSLPPAAGTAPTTQEFSAAPEVQPEPAVRRPTCDAAPDSITLVLIAEDNRTSQRVSTLQLKQLGLVAHVVSNGREAVDAHECQPYALILMDCQMPEMDGFEATRRIRQKEKQSGLRTPIIGLTAEAMEGARERCLAAGMDDYISKPATLERLREVIEKWISGQRESAGEAGRSVNASGGK